MCFWTKKSSIILVNPPRGENHKTAFIQWNKSMNSNIWYRIPNWLFSGWPCLNFIRTGQLENLFEKSATLLGRGYGSWAQVELVAMFMPSGCSLNSPRTALMDHLSYWSQHLYPFGFALMRMLFLKLFVKVLKTKSTTNNNKNKFNLDSYMWKSTSKGQTYARELKSIGGIIYLCQLSMGLTFIWKQFN